MEGDALRDLSDLLELEQLERDYFRGRSPWAPGMQGRGRIFGGQVLGQALMAAGRTLEDRAATRPVHSLQAYFLLGGDPSVPMLFEVDRIRDGRSFTTRRVRVMQHGEAIFALSASFHIPEDGPEHNLARMPEVPPASDDADAGDEAMPFRRMGGGMGAVLQRYVDPAGMGGAEQRIWTRADGRLPDDPLLHASVVAFASDMGLVSTIAAPHGGWGRDAARGGPGTWPGGFMTASLDHAMWFHRPFRADEWFLYTRSSPSAHGARGLAHGHMYLPDGTLVVTIVQEGLIRPPRPR